MDYRIFSLWLDRLREFGVPKIGQYVMDATGRSGLIYNLAGLSTDKSKGKGAERLYDISEDGVQLSPPPTSFLLTHETTLGWSFSL